MDPLAYIDAVATWVPELEAAGWTVDVVNTAVLPGVLALSRGGSQLQVSLLEPERLAALAEPEPSPPDPDDDAPVAA